VAIGAGLVVLLCLIAVGGWVGANALLHQEEPRELWTEKDMPPLPREAENGWWTFADGTSGLADADIPKPLTDLCGVAAEDAPTAWRRVERRQDEIAEATRDPSNRPWIELLSRACAMPEFADACPIEAEEMCPALSFFRAHQAADLALLHRALSGRWDDAFSGTALLTRGDFAFAGSARTLIDQMVAFAMTSRLLDLLDVLLVGYDQRGEAEPGVRASTWQELEQSLARPDAADLSMRRCVMGEYIFAVRALDRVGRAPAKSGIASNWGSLGILFFDRGGTLQLLNDEYRVVMEHAEGKGPPGRLPPKTYTDDTMWWLGNPVGKMALDTLRAHIIPRIQEGRKKGAAITARREHIRKAVEARRAAPSPASSKE